MLISYPTNGEYKSEVVSRLSPSNQRRMEEWKEEEEEEEEEEDRHQEGLRGYQDRS